MYTEGQTLKITATPDSLYAKIYGNRALTVTVIDARDGIMFVHLSTADAAMLPDNRDELKIVYEPRTIVYYQDWIIEVVQPEPTQEQPTPANKKPVYTITEKDFQDADRCGQSWHSDNVEPWGNGRITMGPSHIELEVPAGKNTLSVGIRKYAPGRFYDNETRTGYPHEVWEIDSPYLITPDGEEFAPTDLIDRIEIEGYRRVWSGAYVAIDDLDKWITAGEAQRLYGVAPATVRQAINREIDDTGEQPSWARKSGGTWMVKADEAGNRWGNRK